LHNATGNKGEVHLELDEYEEAQRCFQRAGQFFHEAGMRWLESENLWRLARLLIAVGEYEQAQTALRECIVLAPKEDNPEAFAMAHSLLAEIVWQLGDVAQAFSHFEQAAEAFKSVRRPLTVGRFSTILKAKLLLELGEIEQAETALAELWPLLGQAGRNPVVVESGLLQAKIKAATGGLDEAQKQLEDLLSTNLRFHEQAAVHYELWQLTGSEEHGRQALIQYQQLADRSPNLTYRHRITTLRAARPLPG
jgi:tetratricopeptide (TPR) repeat protein